MSVNDGDKGISSSGHAQLVGAFSTGPGAHAEVGDITVPGTPAQESATRRELMELLRQFIAELQRSGHPDRADLIEATEDVQEELTTAAPRPGKLKTMAKGLAAAVAGTTSLAALAAAIEQAIGRF